MVVFDLDDTLYCERDFALSGFAAAGALHAAETGVEGLGALCAALFDGGARGRIFDEALARLGAPDAAARVPGLVRAYRDHVPRIALAPDAARWLGRRAPGLRLGLVTDGPPGTQRAKVRALGLEDAFEVAAFTGDWGEGFGKPHPRAFELVERRSGLAPARLLYVADNPAKDFLAPRARGWRTLRIVRPERVHRAPAPGPGHEAEAEIASIEALDVWLPRLGLAAPPGAAA
jgi:putative hydrolase of the HAD superfamily